MRLDVDTASRGARSAPAEQVRNATTRARPAPAKPSVVPPPGDGRAEALAITGMCADLVSRMLVEPAPDQDDISDEMERLRRAAVGWACRDVSIETVNRAVCSAVNVALAQLAEKFANNSDGLVPAVQQLLRIREQMLFTILAGFTAVVMLDGDGAGAPLDVLAENIAAGRVEMLPSGAVIAESYAVVAVAFVAAGEQATETVARGGPSRARLALAQRFGPSTLSALGVGGGTILVPAATADERTLDQLVAVVSRAVRAPVTAVLAGGHRAELSEVAEHAHTLLDIAQRLGYVAKLYVVDDLALEYQLTRPGPARDVMAAILDPLERFPQLMETLRVHMGVGMNQKGTAGSLGVHRNTVGYRLRRIEDLTGYDPTTQSGLCYLRSAYLVRRFRGPGSGSCRGNTSTFQNMH